MKSRNNNACYRPFDPNHDTKGNQRRDFFDHVRMYTVVFHEANVCMLRVYSHDFCGSINDRRRLEGNENFREP